MRRRDFVKAMVAAPVTAKAGWGQQASSLPAATPPTAPAAPPATPAQTPYAARRRYDFKAPPIVTVVSDAVAETEVRFFSEAQFATLTRLCDLLMPALDGYPGALTASAPEFLDFLVSSSADDTQRLYGSGLDRLHGDAKKKYGAAFADLNDKQADAIVRPALKPWMQWHPPTEPFEHFIAMAHDDIRKATMNSEAWSLAALAAGERTPGVGMFWYPIDPDMKKWI